MNKPILIPVIFALGTAFFWGLYGPTIGNAQIKVQPPNGWSPFKPYVFIGVAYLVLAVGGGLLMMKYKGDSFTYSGPVPETTRTHFEPAKWGFLAGCLGAAGALCLTTAMMTSKGNALLVMPIVFGGAVSWTAIVSAYRLREHTTLSGNLWLGIAVVALGIVIVAVNTPHHGPAKPAATQHADSPGDGH